MRVHEIRRELCQILNQTIAHWVIVVELDEIVLLDKSLLLSVGTAHDRNRDVSRHL